MDFFLAVLLIVALSAACIQDVRFRKIPNRITFSVMAIALAHHSLSGGFYGFASSVTGLLLGMGIFFIPYLFGIMGAGDAKFMGAVGAVLGPVDLLTVAVLATLSGGIYAVTVMVVNHRYGLNFISRLHITFTSLLRFRKYVPFGPEPGRGISIPYAVPIAMGTALHLTLTRLGCQPLTWIIG